MKREPGHRPGLVRGQLAEARGGARGGGCPWKTGPRPPRAHLQTAITGFHGPIPGSTILSVTRLVEWQIDQVQPTSYSPHCSTNLLWPPDNLEAEAAGWVVLEETDLP